MTRGEPLSFLWTATDGATFVYLWGWGAWVRLEATEAASTPRKLLETLAWIIGGPRARHGWTAHPMELDRALEGTPVVRRLEPARAMTIDDLIPTPREFLDFLERRSFT